MSDYQDYIDTVKNAPAQEVWNPKLGQNVYTNNNPAAYMGANAQDYSGYGGAVSHQGGLAQGADAYGVNTGTRNTPGGQLRTDFEQSNMNPYDQGAQGRYQGDLNKMWPQIQVGPHSVRPNFGFSKDYGVVDVGSGLKPTSWDQFDGSQKGWWTIDPREQKTLEGAAQAGSPYMKDLMAQKGITGLPNFGLGFNYNNGNPQARHLTAMQNFARKYYMPALMSIGPAMMSGGVGAVYGPAMGALAGAASGAMTQGMQTGWQNPKALALGAAGGAAGGYGGGALGQAADLGPMATGALSAAGNSVGSGIGRSIGTGQWDAGQLARNAAISGVVGGATGALMPAPTAGEPPNPFLGAAAGQVGGSVRQILNNVLPGAPQAPQQPISQAQIDAQKKRRFAISQQQMNPYK